MHLDPDFEHLTYGDQGERAKQLSSLKPSDLIVFYAALRNMHHPKELIYGVIGIFIVERLVSLADAIVSKPDFNAHTRRVLKENPTDLVVLARPDVSGRLQRCIPIGEYRDRAYRARPDILEAWGGLSVKGGYLQRSARLPQFLDAPCFMRWFERQRPNLMEANN